MKSYEATGKTREEAISAGLEELGLTIGEANVEVIEEGSKGLFGLFGSRPWRVRITAIEEEKETVLDAHSLFADSLEEKKPVVREKKEVKAEKSPVSEKKPAAPKAPRQNPKPQAAKKADEEVKETAETEAPAEKKQARRPARKPRPKQENESTEPKAPIVPAEQADPETAAGRAQTFLQEVTKLMGVEVAVAVANDEEGNVRVNMNGDSQGILIGRRGETLDALQYLTSLQVNKGRAEYTRVTIDTEGYRARREEALIRLANRMANRAIKTGRRVSLEPMNPYERRILHSALQGNEAVTTHSEGEEPNRHVVITLNKPVRNRKNAEAAPAVEPEATEAIETVETNEEQA